MEFKAEEKDGALVVKPIIERKLNKKGGTDVIIHVPSFPLINKLSKEIKDGKRNLQ